MAAAAVSVEDDLTCPICFELFVDPYTPKSLPKCGHVLCEVCLKQMLDGKCQRTCPECRKVIKMPMDGIASFTTIYRLRNLAENHQKTSDNMPGIQMSPKKGGVPLCPDHEDEKMHYYCVTCNSLACQACLTLKHNGTEHNIEDAKELYKKQKVEMESASTRTISKIAEAESTIAELKTVKIQSTEFFKKVEKHVDKCIESHMNELLTKGQELKNKVEQVKQIHMTGLNRETLNVQENINSAKLAYQATVSAIEDIPDYEYLTQHPILVNKMGDIQISKPTTLAANKTKLDAIKFVKSSSHTNLGKIVSVTPGKARAVKKSQTIDGFGVAYTFDFNSDGLLAIVDLNEKKVVIYDKVNGKYEKKLHLKLASNNQCEPRGVAICSDGRFMVARVTCIEVYSPDGNHQYGIKIHGSDKLKVHHIKVTSDGRILIGDYGRYLIVEINQMGEVIRTLHTSIMPTHMTLIHNTHIAISDNKAGKVIAIHIESGQETLSIGIQGVLGICYDEHTECLLTVRSVPSFLPNRRLINTGVIEQYSFTTGKLIACLQQGLYAPRGMAMTSDEHLIVANCRVVEIYEVK